MRVAVAGTALFTGLLGGLTHSASAASGGPCPFISDIANDQTAMPGYTTATDTTPGATALDLRSADITADAKNLSVVIRVTNLRDTEPVYAGHVYSFYFDAEAQKFSISANLSSDGNDFTVSAGPRSADGKAVSMSILADIKGIADLGRNEIRMTVPRTLLSKNGAVGGVTGLSVYAAREAQTSKVHGPVLYAEHVGFVNSEDIASTDRAYRIGARGCVPVMH